MHALLLSAALITGSTVAEKSDTSTTTIETTAGHHHHRSSTFRKDVHILLYDHGYDSLNRLENDPASSIHFVKERSAISKIRTTVYGGRLKSHGLGDKLRLLKPFLEVANPAELIVVANAREVVLNVPDREAGATEAVDSFLSNFRMLADKHPNAVVFSAEEGCCSDAMGHARPGDYFDVTKKERKNRACQPGNEGCLLDTSDEESIQDNTSSWKEAMLALALDETAPSGRMESETVYLNSGILAGYPKDLMELLRLSDIEASEDDRAVLTDLMLAYPDKIVLDYHQELFGTNPVRKGLEEGCRFERQDESESGAIEALIHSQHRTIPLLLHTPWRFYDCLDLLICELGGTSQERYLQEYGDGQEGIDRRLQIFPEAIEYDNVYDIYGADDYGYMYGNYGQYGNYGLFRFFQQLILLPIGYFGYEGNYGNYGYVAHGQYGYYDPNYGNYGQYGNYGMFGYMAYIIGDYISVPNVGYYLNFYSNYGNYGQYGVYDEVEHETIDDYSVVNAATITDLREHPEHLEHPTYPPTSFHEELTSEYSDWDYDIWNGARR